MLREKIIAIAGEGEWETDIAALKETLNMLGSSLPPELVEYLQTCVPSSSYEAWKINFYDVQDMVEQNRDYEPGCHVCSHGFLCFACEGDGSQYAYCIGTNRVFHLGFDYGENAQETREMAWKSWPSLSTFLDHVQAEQE